MTDLMNPKPKPSQSLNLSQNSETLGSPFAKSQDTLLTNITIEKKLGSGNFGSVYLGKWMGDKVALKELKTESSFIQKEFQIMEQLNHRNIVRLFGLFKAESLMIVSEYCPEGDLKSLLDKSVDALSSHELLFMSLHIARGMLYLSSKNILHNDLAARNVLVSLNERTNENKYLCKIGDFGLSEFHDSKYVYDMTHQKPVAWSSPEVLQRGKYSIYSGTPLCYE